MWRMMLLQGRARWRSTIPHAEAPLIRPGRLELLGLSMPCLYTGFVFGAGSCLLCSDPASVTAGTGEEAPSLHSHREM